DVGCNVGWYCFKLASLGIPTAGVEGYPPYYRTAIYAGSRLKVDNVAIVPMMLNETNVRVLPTADCTLFLAVWHHAVRSSGVPTATAILSAVWQRTDKVLFFESGETEMGPAFGMPELTPDARTWFADYLTRVCPGASIRHLGLHHAGNGGGAVA